MKIFNKYYLKNIKQISINIYLFIMSLTIIGLFIYFRIILKRSSYSLELLKNFVDLKYLCLCLLLLLLHIFAVLHIIYYKLYKSDKETELIKKIKSIIDFIFWKPLMFLLDKISPYIPYSGTFFINYCYFFRKNEFRLFLMKFLCFLLYFLPKIVMSILFFIEIFFYKKIFYFIKFIWILLIPIIYLIFLNLSEKFYTNNMPEILSRVYVTSEGEPNQNGVYLKHKFQLKDTVTYTENDLKEYIEAWDILFYLLNLNTIIRLFINQWSSYVTLFVSSLYIMSFSYKIYYLFIF